MPRNITVRIRRDGGLETEFTGFAGQDCVGEAEKLQRALAALGVTVSLEDVVFKSPEALAAETRTVEERADQKVGPERRGRP
jgi:hypothetical protein